MKIVIVFLLSFSIIAIAIDDECENKQKTTEKKIAEPNSLNGDYINLIARQVFNDETGIYDFIGVDCNKLYNKKNGEWTCVIRQTATKFKKGKFTVNPPGVGNWMLTINFITNTYLLK